MNIKTSLEAPRGCGFREKGGFYFRTDGPGFPCGMMPLIFKECDCCGYIPQKVRGFTWINTSYLKGLQYTCRSKICLACGLKKIFEEKKVALDWIGKRAYPTTNSFSKEADSRGISRRLPAKIGKDGKLNIGLSGFNVGTHWIALAHENAIRIEGTKVIEQGPGIIRIYKPEKIEYVVKDNDTPDKLENLASQGIELVNVIRQTTKEIFS